MEAFFIHTSKLPKRTGWALIWKRLLASDTFPWTYKFRKSSLLSLFSANSSHYILFDNKAAWFSSVQFSSVAQSCLTLWPCGVQHARLPCPSQTPRVHPNSCSLSCWCHPTVSSSVVPFSSCPQSLWDQGLFQWVNYLNQVAKVLEFQLQHQSFPWTTRTDLL